MEGCLKPTSLSRIRWTEKALQYLEVAILYVAEDSPQAAEAMAKKIYLSVNTLGLHSQIGRPGRCKGTCELVITGTPYIIPYRVNGDQIEILRVLHGARKWPMNL